MNEFGKPLWIIWPIGYKVRARKDKKSGSLDVPNCGSISWDSPLGDIAGYDTLMESLNRLGFIESDPENDYEEKDLEDFQLEPLNPDWKTDLLDFYSEFWETLWGCEKGDLPELPDELTVDDLKRLGIPGSYPYYNRRKEIAPLCEQHNLGKPIPVALKDFNETVKWIETHMKKEKVKKDRRGTNPNSLKNLKHFKGDKTKKKKK